MLRKPYNLVLFAIGLFGGLILGACQAKAEGFSFEFGTEEHSEWEVSDQRFHKLSFLDCSSERICYSKKTLNQIDFTISDYYECLILGTKIKPHLSELALFDKKEFRIHTGLSPPFLLS
jgi:hypothetical protein